ncbi:hypothetical protein CDAR_25131 [Caerostris darwini]|uniref:Uncharacterized protein n=1 Tax=Caerostris darwini TaxID=1538125 RepID=A0AAV4N218_9ARAC|nr:hypothetical protein CDAR_25131 [Caerostris darwini]
MNKSVKISMSQKRRRDRITKDTRSCDQECHRTGDNSEETAVRRAQNQMMELSDKEKNYNSPYLVSYGYVSPAMTETEYI